MAVTYNPFAIQPAQPAATNLDRQALLRRLEIAQQMGQKARPNPYMNTVPGGLAYVVDKYAEGRDRNQRAQYLRALEQRETADRQQAANLWGQMIPGQQPAPQPVQGPPPAPIQGPVQGPPQAAPQPTPQPVPQPTQAPGQDYDREMLRAMLKNPQTAPIAQKIIMDLRNRNQPLSPQAAADLEHKRAQTEALRRQRPPETTYDRTLQAAQAKEDAKRAALRKGGGQVLDMVGMLEAEFDERRNPDIKSIMGPLDSRTPDLLLTDKERTLRLRVNQSVQAINSVMQRALLAGGGSITEAEREAIDRIQGQLLNVREPTAARELLRNYRNIVSNIFGGPEQPTTGQAAAPDGGWSIKKVE